MVTSESGKISRMLKRRQRVASVRNRTEFVVVKIALLAVLVSALNSLLNYGVNSDFADAFVWANVKKWTLILTLMFITSAALIYLFVSLLKRKTRATTELEAKVVKAYQQALDESSFNPHLNKRHEQLTG